MEIKITLSKAVLLAALTSAMTFVAGFEHGRNNAKHTGVCLSQVKTTHLHAKESSSRHKVRHPVSTIKSV